MLESTSADAARIAELEREVASLRCALESARASSEETRKREELFRAALQNSPIVVFHQDTELRYTWLYNPFPEHTGISLLGKVDNELFPADQAEQLNGLKLGVLRSGQGARLEVPLTTQGELRVMDLRIEPFNDSSGKPAGILGTAVDVTDRKRREQSLTDSRSQLRGLAAHLQVLRERERSLTSHEVHELGQRLAALDLQLSVLAGHLSEGATPDVMAERLKAVSGIISATIESSARISVDLRPSLLDTLGLGVALEWHAREFASRTGIRLAAATFEDLRPDPDTAIAVFRILQYALDNVERHSGASQVRISLRWVDGNLILMVCDDGIGIGSDKLADPKSLGILAMRELALQCGGVIDIYGTEAGTTVALEIPLYR